MPDINLSLKVPAIEKLIDYGASGVGAIAGPMLAPWRASREAKARLASTRIDVEAHRIEAESEAGTSAIIAKARSEARGYLVTPDAEVRGTLEITREDITQRIEFQERKRIANVRSVLEDAADELGDKEVADHEPDPDWTARFFDCVQDVSSEDMQKIWAKILAGEVESPGQTSLRTLDTLRNMTKIDAELFKGICNLVIEQNCVFFDESYLKGFDALRYDNLIHLQDCRLVTIQSFLSRHIAWEEKKELVFAYQNGALLIACNQEAPEVLAIPVALLTTAGRELFQIVECTPDWGYLRAFSKFLMSKDCRLDYLAGVESLPGGMVRYTNRIPIEPKSEQVDGPTP